MMGKAFYLSNFLTFYLSQMIAYVDFLNVFQHGVDDFLSRQLDSLRSAPVDCE